MVNVTVIGIFLDPDDSFKLMWIVLSIVVLFRGFSCLWYVALCRAKSRYL